MNAPHSSRKWLIGVALFWIVVGAAITGRVALFDQLAAPAASKSVTAGETLPRPVASTGAISGL